MVKKMIYLDEAMGKALERIAHAEHKSVSAVIREAVGQLFRRKEYYDLAVYDKRMAEYLGKPASAVGFRDIMDD